MHQSAIRREMCMNDEFYVGYLPKAPPQTARTVRYTVMALIAAALGVAAILLAGQSAFPPAKFEFGQYREYAGKIETWPYASLLTSNGRFLLVGPGKHGVAELFRNDAGHSVSLKASSIVRGGEHMLEIVPASLKVDGSAAIPTATPEALGPVKMTGEIVDTKCFLGVMNPGNGKVHRDCAARCISGGIPPALLVRDRDGATRLLLLAGNSGRPLHEEILQFVAQPVEISGMLYRVHGDLVLIAEPSDFRRE